MFCLGFVKHSCSLLNTLHKAHDESYLNLVHFVGATFEQGIFYTCIATVTAFLSSQGLFQVSAGGLWHP